MKILILSSHTPSLFWFRMDMMQEFIRLGHTVFAAAQESEDKWDEKFKKKGIDYRQIFVQRNGTNPINDLKTYREIHTLLKEIKPDKIFVYQAKTIVYGSLAASRLGIKEVYPLIAGLGSVFRGDNLRSKVLTKIVEFQYRMAFKRSRKVIFQNDDDRDVLLSKGLLKKEQVEKINGSGVNLDLFKPMDLPEKTAFLFIGRLIRDKGIMEYLEACRRIKKKYPAVECLLVGPYDSNPSALKKEELDVYIKEGVVEYFGEQSDVKPYIARCSTFVLPSYHEGTPKTVLEAMAMGRAIITSDAPGCRETVVNGENGYLVEVKNIPGLVSKMEYLIVKPELNKKMGAAGLAMVQEKFDVKKVNAEIIRIMNLN